MLKQPNKWKTINNGMTGKSYVITLVEGRRDRQSPWVQYPPRGNQTEPRTFGFLETSEKRLNWYIGSSESISPPYQVSSIPFETIKHNADFSEVVIAGRFGRITYKQHPSANTPDNTSE